MTDKDIKYWVGFNLIPGIGRMRFAQLENHFGNLENAWQAAPAKLRKTGLDRNVIQAITTWQSRIFLDDEMAKLAHYGVKFFTYKDEKYPTRLKEIYDYPPLRYVRGELLPKDEWCLAVVGTRRATVYGRQVAEEIAADLARNNITVVSDMAKGIDTIAHQAALDAGGRSIAVFACGLDSVYPAENADLARKVMQHGALISEYPLGIKPRPDNFPRRNRIMSGLSMGVLFVEAGETSGAIITAQFALEQKREVFAVPGSILSPASRGTNHLIQEGAKLVRDYTDILEELNLMTVTRQIEMKEILPASDTESMLLKHISAEPTHIDEVCSSSGLPVSIVSGALAMMELKGMVKQMGSMSFILAREVREEYKVRVD